MARALALQPKLVIADEPTAGLDVSVQGEVLNLMTDLKTVMGLSFLIITHNLAVVRHVTDRIAILYLGRVVETGPTREVFARPLHPYTASLIASEPRARPAQAPRRPRHQGRDSQRPEPAHGLRVPHPLPLAQDLCRKTRRNSARSDPDRMSAAILPNLKT